MKEWEDKLSVDILLKDLEGKDMSEQYFLMIKQRLSYEIEYMPNWGDAMYLGLYPTNLQNITGRLNSTINLMCDIAGDQSSGMDL